MTNEVRACQNSHYARASCRKITSILATRLRDLRIHEQRNLVDLRQFAHFTMHFERPLFSRIMDASRVITKSTDNVPF